MIDGTQTKARCSACGRLRPLTLLLRITRLDTGRVRHVCRSQSDGRGGACYREGVGASAIDRVEPAAVTR
jgi:hypothetical protein